MESRPPVLPYTGPWGATVTLPRLVPADLRVFSTECKHSTKLSAFRHVAFVAYRTLYEAGLLNANLLPLTSVIEPDLEEEVLAMLKDVEKRSGTASVSIQVDPWVPERASDVWFCTEISIDTLPPLRMFSRTRPNDLSAEEFPILHHPYRRRLQVRTRAVELLHISTTTVKQAQDYTRKIFWEMYGTRMIWDEVDFAYLFLPVEADPDAAKWAARSSWFYEMYNQEGGLDPIETPHVDANLFGQRYSFPSDLVLVRERGSAIKNFRFIRWRSGGLSLKEEETFRDRYKLGSNDPIPSPLLAVKRFPNRMNFLLRLPPQTGKHSIEDEILLRPTSSTVTLLSATDTEYALLLPSIIRYLSISMTVDSLRTTLLTPTLASIPLQLLRAAITAPVAQAEFDYQRMETLGDTVLKFTAGLQLLADYPLWHEGYLTRKKDHSVSNSRLAKDAHAKRLYRWIIRDRFSAQKWKPKYFTAVAENAERGLNDAEKKRDEPQQLSTKMLADVGESLFL